MKGISILNELISQGANGCYRARKKEIPIGLGNTLRYLTSKNLSRIEVKDKTIFPLDEMGIEYVENETMKELIKKCWCQKPIERLSIDQIIIQLENELIKLK